MVVSSVVYYSLDGVKGCESKVPAIKITAALVVSMLQNALKPGEVLMVLSVAKAMVEKEPARVGRQAG